MRIILYLLIAKALLFLIASLWSPSEPERTFGAAPQAASVVPAG